MIQIEFIFNSYLYIIIYHIIQVKSNPNFSISLHKISISGVKISVDVVIGVQFGAGRCAPVVKCKVGIRKNVGAFGGVDVVGQRCRHGRPHGRPYKVSIRP